MSVNYSVVLRKNPGKIDDVGKYYALAQANGELNFNRLCKDVKSRCTVTRADMAGVIEAIVESMIYALEDGKIVRLGNFGSFQISLTGDGAETEKEYNASMIRGSKIVFRPGEMLVDMMKTLSYSQVPVLPKQAAKEPEIPEEGL
ncbi:HU family DNA-binding protein [Bacteroides sedimenti]|uniref:HU domain-containing protein n=1 Tax=Bacteroides sedimenti TaxID=2136147 RepID=A0ABN6Z6Z5_9BACE